MTTTPVGPTGATPAGSAGTATGRTPVETTEAGAGPLGALRVVGGAALVLAPVLLAAGALTSPPQDGDGDAAYIASLAADPSLTAWSATLLHYAWVLFALGCVVAIGLVRGRRGRGLALVGGLTGAFGAVQISGLLLNDWFLSAMGRELSMEQAVEVFRLSTGDAHVAVWLATGQVLSTVGPTLLFAGLARAGVISWWLVPPSLMIMMAFFLVPGPLGILVGLLCGAASVVTGVRLVQRGRLAG